ncbi:cell division protein FtsA [Pelagirhabdus alkalitolerans]|uniref:Cell division protein FtsA n=1 Tax=Pelagirhabdus alkalitolerans TaxID=1612202 RepID=A0A1G6HIL9_9BACI|nr:pilus assembly protein PilM [Pelagirhabdus alkalitolerans]SDB94051.1 cell division protein FtsA [Pelagirhabdus alkalitolerans]
MTNLIFALDIGTRSVIGLLLEADGSEYKLYDYCIHEHDKRSMLDGQIHDVVLVSNVIKEVKQELEDRHDLTLNKVCVAAAGRALKTKRTRIEKDIHQHPLMEKEDILFLELSAVQNAQYELALEEENENSQTHYYCVGYSVLQYKLDHDIIGSLIDQQGHKAEVEIIATFLPKVVVESLLAALQRANLEMEALTLEPIAAINVLIPESMRRLNISLVDIGAGTSDIALTDEGTITAYGMVSKAGDEITEAISDQYLLDFNEAERVKREITSHGEANITDILGFSEVITFEDLAKTIKESIEDLASAIADKILELNSKSPKAVMLVGGGSLTPRLSTVLAKKLNLPENRVAARGTDAIPNLKTMIDIPTGPAFITPIGIAIAAKQNPVHYISVTVNGRAVRLFDMKHLTVGDCLLAAGIYIDKMYGKPGMAYIVTFNNQNITLPGTHGEPPKLLLNDEPIEVDQPIKHGDHLIVEKGQDGLEPNVTLAEVIDDYQAFTIEFNDQTFTIKPKLKVNNQFVQGTYQLKDHDQISVKESLTLREWLHEVGKASLIDQLNQMTIYLNDEKINLTNFSAKLTVNNRKAVLDQPLKPNDKIIYHPAKRVTVEDLFVHLDMPSSQSINVYFNGKPVTLEKETQSLLQDNQVLTKETVIEPESRLTTQKSEETPFIFQDIFKVVSIDLTEVKGNVSLMINKQPATFLDPLNENDQVELKF